MRLDGEGRYGGKGVLKAVDSINGEIMDALVGEEERLRVLLLRVLLLCVAA